MIYVILTVVSILTFCLCLYFTNCYKKSNKQNKAKNDQDLEVDLLKIQNLKKQQKKKKARRKNQMKSNQMKTKLKKQKENSRTTTLKVQRNSKFTQISYTNQQGKNEIQYFGDYVVKQLNLQGYSHIVIQLHQIYYGQFQSKSDEVQNDFLKWQGLGFHYQVKYSALSCNPYYIMYEGLFDNGARNGQGTLFAQKSKIVEYKGEWLNNQQLQENVRPQQIEIDISKVEKRIIIKENGVVINSNLPRHQTQLQQTWIMFNQQISKQDINILKNSQGLFTSSIIDAFSLYLNIEDEKQFFSFGDLEKQMQHQRVIFFPSDIYTSMHLGQEEKNKQIFHKHILEYEPIGYQIQRVFKKIYFIINQNFHWFLVQIDLPLKNLFVFDSIQSSKKSYLNVFLIINALFDNKLQSIRFIQTQQQKNNYDCGPFTCLNMVNQTSLQIQQTLQTPNQVRLFLLELLQEKQIEYEN